MHYKYLFGPVLSRRLGISLGVDLIPYKICNLNCLYCESGATTKHLNLRDEYVPYLEIIRELDHYLSVNPKVDFITFSGAGEPTLHKDIGKIIQHIKENFPAFKIALITNSILFSDPQLRQEVLLSDLVLPSLDAASQEVFEKINRPCKNINIEEVINGLIEFREIYKGKIWLEIFIIPGINDTAKELSLLKEKVTLIKPDIVQLNSLDRPGTEKWISAAEPQELEKIKNFFSPLPAEIISKNYSHFKIRQEGIAHTELILSTIKRRPCTASEIATITELNLADAEMLLNMLEFEGQITKSNTQGETFYQVN